VLHYTELPLRESLDVLTDASRPTRVSAHYLIAENGTIHQLVPESRVAWHAGRSWWRGREALNGTSIGLEIVNLWGDTNEYPAPQVAALIELCHRIREHHPAIVPRNIVGHSDIAPRRKIDPGTCFPWRTLAEAGIGLWPRSADRFLEGDIQPALQQFGYMPPGEVPAEEIVKAFQRHFRPSRIDGVADAETRALLADLLDQVGNDP
jgi:N-acetylmuramoyl-L-alanine amidase